MNKMIDNNSKPLSTAESSSTVSAGFLKQINELGAKISGLNEKCICKIKNLSS